MGVPAPLLLTIPAGDLEPGDRVAGSPVIEVVDVSTHDGMAAVEHLLHGRWRATWQLGADQLVTVWRGAAPVAQVTP